MQSDDMIGQHPRHCESLCISATAITVSAHAPMMTAVETSSTTSSAATVRPAATPPTGTSERPNASVPRLPSPPPTAPPPPPPPPPTTPGDELCTATHENNVYRITAICAASTVPLRDSAGHTALHWAALSMSAQTLLVVLRLTRHPVDAISEAPEQRGQTPLHWALVAGSAPCVAALLQAGARPSARDAR
eukprot:IDg12965t1